jgi:hypothetical protein
VESFWQVIPQKKDAHFDSIRNDPRSKQLLRKLKRRSGPSHYLCLQIARPFRLTCLAEIDYDGRHAHGRDILCASPDIDNHVATGSVIGRAARIAAAMASPTK